MKHLRIGSRGSDLALWQANDVKRQLKEKGIDSEIIVIKTKGDIITNIGFDKMEGKGFFTKEIEDALLDNQIDLAVHCMKDMTTDNPELLKIAGISSRENPADWLIIHPEAIDENNTLRLKENPVIGTSSARRKVQILYLRQDAKTKDLRGNVPTRIQKLREKEYDAIILAAAGIIRLGLDLSDLIVVPLHFSEFIPAPAQGVLAYQTRREDSESIKSVRLIHDEIALRSVSIERKILKLMDGGCQMPLGIYCEIDSAGNYHVHAAVADQLDGPLNRVRLSRSTNFELAEDVVSELKRR